MSRSTRRSARFLTLRMAAHTFSLVLLVSCSSRSQTAADSEGWFTVRCHDVDCQEEARKRCDGPYRTRDERGQFYDMGTGPNFIGSIRVRCTPAQ